MLWWTTTLTRSTQLTICNLYFFCIYFKPFSVNCLSCYTCTSDDSWADCNSKMTKTGCPSGTPNCAKSLLTCSAGGVTKTFFYKRCGTQGKDCQPTNHPSCPTSASGWTFSSDDKCCSGNNCNSGPLNNISGVLTGISIFLALWGLFIFLKWSATFFKHMKTDLFRYAVIHSRFKALIAL